MKKVSYLIASFALVFAVSASWALDYEPVAARDGVEVSVKYDPLGFNNQIVAFVRFINTNTHKVNVNWKPLITCEGEAASKGYGSALDIEAGESYEVTIWRSAACGMRILKAINIDMEVK